MPWLRHQRSCARVGNVLGVVEMRLGLVGAAQGGLRCAVLMAAVCPVDSRTVLHACLGEVEEGDQ